MSLVSHSIRFSRAVVFFFALLTAAPGRLFAEAEPSTLSEAGAIEQLQAWLKFPRDKRPALEQQIFSAAPLSKAAAERVKQALWKDHAEWIAESRAAEMKERVIEAGGKKMKFETVKFGAKPKDGFSLFISMHGGGGAPAEVNESQWKNQIKLGQAYRPREGLYVAPRAPTDTWNLWHQPHIDALFDRLIQNMIVIEGVNPNRVYIMGYSAGGDGVYQLAGRMADRLAAASMMAGHPNQSSPLGLRNIGFAIHVGAEDAGYNRNKVAATWGQKLDELQKDDPTGYAHVTEIHAGKGHWMDLEDRKAVPWMEQFSRDPLPKKIVWFQDGAMHDRFYWLTVDSGAAKPGQKVVAERIGQTIEIKAEGLTALNVLLNDGMLDLEQPVKVVLNGKAVFEGSARRTIANLQQSMAEYGDPANVFSAKIRAAQ